MSGPRFIKLRPSRIVPQERSATASEEYAAVVTIALPCQMNKVYDVIQEAHCKITGHCGRDATYAIVKENFYNISQAMVTTFIKACTVCVRRNISCKTLPGAKPLHKLQR